MSDIIAAVRNKLLATADITELVGTRVTADVAAENENSAHVVIKEIASEEFEHLAGTSGSADTRLSFECCARTPSAATALRTLVWETLRPWRGTALGVRVSDVQTRSRYSAYSPPVEGRAFGWFVRIVDLSFVHTTTALENE